MTPTRKPAQMLTDQQLARLFTRLQVPVTIQSLLDDQRLLDDENRLAICDMISGQTPDQALLSIALSAMLLDARLRENGHRCAEILAMSAEMIVQDYAPLYVAHLEKNKNGSLFDRSDIEFLSTIPEDLESLSDLLSVVADVVPADCHIYRVIATILAAQASAQALLAETLVETMDDVLMDSVLGTLDDTAHTAISSPFPSDNVIPFKRRNHT